jgi:hypothetical protein
MKRTIVIALLLSCAVLPAALVAKEKGAPVDMKSFHRVFIGWVDVNPEDYHMLGYSTKQEWSDVINAANVNFQKDCESLKGLSGRTVAGAKDKNDIGTAGNDFYIKFSDVQFDHKYQLHLSVHFIDLKTNSEVGSIPLESHGAHFCSLSGCLDKELAQVREQMQKQLVGD